MIFAFLATSHLIYGNTIVEKQINVTENNTTRIQTIKVCSKRQGKYLEFYNGVWNKLLLVIGSVVPIILIITGNLIVAISLIKSRRALRRVQDSSGVVLGNSSGPPPTNYSNFKLFFILCSVFVMTTIPYGIYINIVKLNKEVDEHGLAKYQLASVLMRCFIWCNFSFNFFLYVMTGSLFRKEFRRIFGSAFRSLCRRSGQNRNEQNIPCCFA
jgi:hypothetical protein